MSGRAKRAPARPRNTKPRASTAMTTTPQARAASRAIAKASASAMESKPMPGAYTSFGYRSATVLSREGRRAQQGVAGHVHQATHRAQIVAMSREFMRENELYKGLIDRAVSYICGPGFGLDVNTANAAWNAKVERLWGAYWQDRDARPEVRRLLNGRRLLKHVGRELLVAGDTAAILGVGADETQVQHIESEQIVPPGGTYTDPGAGVELDQYGAPIRFHIGSYANGYLQPTKTTPYDAERVAFVVDPERPTATRGMPAMQSAFPMLHRIKDVLDAEALAWQLLSRLALSTNRENSGVIGDGESIVDTDTTTDGSGLSTRVTELDYALIFHGEPGETVQGIDRNIPGQNFGESLRMFLRLLGLPLGLPLEVVLLDWTQSNYSQSRAVLEQAYQTFQDWQEILQGFCTQIYLWKVQQWIDEGQLSKRRDWKEHSWVVPSFPWLDLLKEVQARVKGMETGIETYAQVVKSRGKDPEHQRATRASEITEAIKTAQAIQKETGEKVDWRIFAGLTPAQTSTPTPGAVPAAGAPPNETADDDEDSDE